MKVRGVEVMPECSGHSDTGRGEGSGSHPSSRQRGFHRWDRTQCPGNCTWTQGKSSKSLFQLNENSNVQKKFRWFYSCIFEGFQVCFEFTNHSLKCVVPPLIPALIIYVLLFWSLSTQIACHHFLNLFVIWTSFRAWLPYLGFLPYLCATL